MSPIRLHPLRWLLVSVLLASAGAPLSAQGAKRNAIHVEALGPAIIGSLNYERLFGESFSARVGLGGVPGLDWDAVLAPVLLNGFVGQGPHRLEVGGGAVLGYRIPVAEAELGAADFVRPYLTGTLAYRHQSASGGIYRIGLTPILSLRGGRQQVVRTFAASVGVAL